jgi:hypothetical protein
MPPGFSLNTDLTLGVNAPLVGTISLSLWKSRPKIGTLFQDGGDVWEYNTQGNFLECFKKEDKHFYC